MLLQNQRDHRVGVLLERIAGLERESERLRNEALKWFQTNLELHAEIKKLKADNELRSLRNDVAL
jgi:hypothetical protein